MPRREDMDPDTATPSAVFRKSRTTYGAASRGALRNVKEQNVLESQTQANLRPIQNIEREGPGTLQRRLDVDPPGVLCSVVPTGSKSNCVPSGRGQQRLPTAGKAAVLTLLSCPPPPGTTRSVS